MQNIKKEGTPLWGYAPVKHRAYALCYYGATLHYNKEAFASSSLSPTLEIV